MKTLSEKEFNGFNVNAMFTERAERAKKELSPLMQEIRKYIPQAEYGYHVESGEYPAFYGVRIEFTYNGIRFHVCKIYKENKYRIAADMEHFEYVNRYDIERAGNQYEKPCNIGVFTAKKINDWINYYTQIYSKYSINSLVYWVTYVHNVVYSFYRSMIYCYINSTQRCAGSIVIDIIPTNGADKRKFFPFAPYFPVTNVIKRYFYPYFPAIIGIKGYSFPYFPYLSGIMKIKTALYSLFSRLDWHKTVVFPCLGEIYEGIRSLSWEIPVT